MGGKKSIVEHQISFRVLLPKREADAIPYPKIHNNKPGNNRGGADASQTLQVRAGQNRVGHHMVDLCLKELSAQEIIKRGSTTWAGTNLAGPYVKIARTYPVFKTLDLAAAIENYSNSILLSAVWLQCPVFNQQVYHIDQPSYLSSRVSLRAWRSALVNKISKL